MSDITTALTDVRCAATATGRTIKIYVVDPTRASAVESARAASVRASEIATPTADIDDQRLARRHRECCLDASAFAAFGSHSAWIAAALRPARVDGDRGYAVWHNPRLRVAHEAEGRRADPTCFGQHPRVIEGDSSRRLPSEEKHPP